MTLDAASLPADLYQWLVCHLPGGFTATDTSWPREGSRVWRLDSDSTATPAAYVKISPSAESHTRETRAYEHAAAALTPGEAPRLLASEPTLRTILTTALPGRVVRDLPLNAATEAHVHELAGRLLSRWHDHREPVPSQARETVMASMAEQAAEAAACLNGLGERLTDAERALVSDVAQDLPALAAGLPLVYLHGDYSLRNWLWNPEEETLGVLDFELADHGLAVQDMIWLHGAIWTTRPDLQESFLTGFGRDLTSDEHHALLLLTTRLAVSYLNTGLAEQETVLIDRGRRALADLVRVHI